MSVRRKDPLLSLLLWWTALVADVLVWLPLVRGPTQGAAYRWVLADGIGGRGVGGHYWLLILAAGFVFALLYLGWRGGRAPFHWLLLVPSAAGGRRLLRRLDAAAGLWFRGGDARGTFSLARIGPLLFGGAAALAVLWVWRPAYPIQSTQNLVGVGLVFWQWVMLNCVLASPAVPAASVAAG